MVEAQVSVTHKVGLHARPASLFVKLANKFNSKISVKNLTLGDNPVDAKSILGVLTLGVMQNHEILIQAEGADAEDAIRELKSLVESNFGES